MDRTVFIIFSCVYFAMILGRIPGLAMDRTGAALLGAITLLAFGKVMPEDAWLAIDVPTIALLLALMIMSAQFRLSGFYTYTVRRIARMDLTPERLLAVIIAVAGGLSAVLANDIVCLAMTPVLIEACSRRNLDPRPYLIALACASNIGSAATLIGNPQNMLIGQVLRLSFSGYLLTAIVPAAAGLAVNWLVIRRLYGGKWALPQTPVEITAPEYNEWQTAKGGVILTGVVMAFLFLPVPREVIALGGAGVLLLSRRMRSREILGLVDWQLLILFISLFILNHAMKSSGNLGLITMSLSDSGIEIAHPGWMFGISVALSNLISNVPAVMLLLPSAHHPLAGPVLALSSTLAGNLFIVGSIANIIVVEQASRFGVEITWREHARTGIPVTLLSLAVAGIWLLIIGTI